MGAPVKAGAAWILLGLAVIGFLALSAAAAQAQQPRAGAYTGLRLLAGHSMVEDARATGLTGSFVESTSEDPTAAAGWLVGYRFDRLPLRLEGEIAHRFRMDYDARDNGGDGVGFETNLATTFALVSAAWELRTDSSWTPFLGGSVGWARNLAEVERVALGTGATTSSETTTNSLALGVMAGVDYEISRHWGTELAYRYLDMGSIETGTLSGGEAIESDSVASHDLMLSLLYRF